MDDDEDTGCIRYLFRSFVCTSLAVLLGLQVYNYLWPSEGLDSDVSDVKYVVMQLTRGLSEVNRKHETLRSEMERLSAVLPSVAAAASNAKDALQTGCCRSKTTLDAGDYDRQITDFALESAGGRVIDTGNTIEHVVYESSVSYLLHIMAAIACRGYECFSARVMLKPGALPGECWAFKGQQGMATIRLLGSIHVNGVSMEHIPPHISPTKEISSAPRLFQLEGLEHRDDLYPHDFGSFEYDKNGSPIQYFEVERPATKPFNMVRLTVITNWGHPVYTCVYRFRVHGELAPGQTPVGITDDELMQIDIE